jgi:hypothetical protein
VPSLRRLLLASALLARLSLPAAASAQTPCPGDCNGDATIDDGDVNQIVASIFAADPSSVCPGLVSDERAALAADLVSAVARFGGECVTPGPPVIPAHDVYRTYVGEVIALPIAAEDADGPLEYSAADLPEGAVLDAQTGVLHWTPTADQIGPFYIPFRVTDHGLPPSSTDGTLALRITPLDSCAIPSCDPATGCESSLPPLTQPCCAPGPVERVAEVVFDCPEGGVLLIGRNPPAKGFGRMQNCDKLRLVALSQSGVTVRINVAARCVTTGQILSLHSRLQTVDEVRTDRIDSVIMQPTSVGFSQRTNVTLDVRNATMALEGQEANLSLTLEDPGTGVSVTETLRVVLTHSELPNLPDLF